MSEMNIPFPFSLIVTDEHENQLNIMPGYWFMHNMYALARNSWKYIDRDKRTDKNAVYRIRLLSSGFCRRNDKLFGINGIRCRKSMV